MTTVQRNVIILSVFSLILGGVGAYAYWVARTQQPKDRVTAFAVSDIKGIKVSARANNFELVGDGQGELKWRLTKPLDAPAEKVFAETIIAHFFDMRSRGTFEVSADTLDRFGLKQPQHSVTFQLNDGSEARYLVGKTNSYDDNTYLWRVGEPLGALVPAAALRVAIDKELFQIREKRLLFFSDTDVRRVDVEIGGRPAYDLQENDGIWTLHVAATGKHPAQTDLKADEARVGVLFASLRAIHAKRFVVEPNEAIDAALYGLDKPAARVTLALANVSAQTKLAIGVVKTAAGADTFYARVEGSPRVIELAESPVAQLDLSREQLRDTSIMHFARDAVRKVTLSAPGKPVVELECTKRDSDGRESWVVSSAGRSKASEPQVTALLYKLFALKSSQLVVEKPSAQDEKLHGIDADSKRIVLSDASGATLASLRYGKVSGEKTTVLAEPSGHIEMTESFSLGDIAFEPSGYSAEASTSSAP